ncbi:hypothetical protein GIB67_007447 [Kingdonia uniflora]|uniref:L-aspartate oxidase n=1 Tax=Kingdonia uniflora TaxID=39325 RepID=A0A7J7P2W4_9MAGN|nr:hypothetical protein GIB67_007447 [Kingdonia uniflora]
MATPWFHVLGYLNRILSSCNFTLRGYMALVVSLLKGFVVKAVFSGIIKVSDLWNGTPQYQGFGIKRCCIKVYDHGNVRRWRCRATEGPLKDHIYLHLNHLPPDVLKKRFPGISKTAAIFVGMEGTKEPIPVLPTVHYNMGGIPINFHGEAVIVKDGNQDIVVLGLMVAGEATCTSVHGTNRLGANSLLDIVDFGRACANRVTEIHKPGEKKKPLENDVGEKTIAWLDILRYSNGSLPTSKIRLNMPRIMQNNAKVFCTQEILEEGCQLIDKAWESFHDVKL